ncbi:MAG: DUF1064 domain-containing protein [Proteobacteria bacterium]|nr:DUF1064 domain-containing protein [Pseudomonadota bacterium]
MSNRNQTLIERARRRKTDVKGSRSTYYTPDFTVFRADGTVEFHEVKGYYGTARAHRSGTGRDGRLKIKIAADRYRHHRFILVWREDGQWHPEEI